jgi:chemotaxis protein MotB
MSQPDKASQEILIIRRGGGEDAPQKGGAWKIAYADFVTAMMAFFLVMWLINSANEVTKARVASYFNPIKMTDAAPLRRGLKETIDAQNPNAQTEATEAKEGSTSAKNQLSPGTKVTDVSSEAELMLSPYTSLDELVKRSGDLSKKGLVEENEAEIGDPFNPRAYTKFPAESDNHDAEKSEISKLSPHAENQQKDTAPEINFESPSKSGEGLKESQEANAKDPASPETIRLAEELREQVEIQVAGLRDRIDLGFKVEVTSEGILLVLEDRSAKSMFAIGSAQPNPALIEIIGGIGGLLSSRDGAVIVRGHTDGRLFRNRKYDNWQLSTDRAHMASYMLIRGGFPETRIMRIEGYGSSKPVMEKEFMLDANRRVEFLVTK